MQHAQQITLSIQWVLQLAVWQIKHGVPLPHPAILVLPPIIVTCANKMMYVLFVNLALTSFRVLPRLDAALQATHGVILQA